MEIPWSMEIFFGFDMVNIYIYIPYEYIYMYINDGEWLINGVSPWLTMIILYNSIVMIVIRMIITLVIMIMIYCIYVYIVYIYMYIEIPWSMERFLGFDMVKKNLWQTNIAIENGHRNSWFTYWK